MFKLKFKSFQSVGATFLNNFHTYVFGEFENKINIIHLQGVKIQGLTLSNIISNNPHDLSPTFYCQHAHTATNDEEKIESS